LSVLVVDVVVQDGKVGVVVVKLDVIVVGEDVGEGDMVENRNEGYYSSFLSLCITYLL
jgi:hypothetical protein